jgi:hypothetical protein
LAEHTKDADLGAGELLCQLRSDRYGSVLV